MGSRMRNFTMNLIKIMEKRRIMKAQYSKVLKLITFSNWWKTLKYKCQIDILLTQKCGWVRLLIIKAKMLASRLVSVIFKNKESRKSGNRFLKILTEIAIISVYIKKCEHGKITLKIKNKTGKVKSKCFTTNVLSLNELPKV